MPFINLEDKYSLGITEIDIQHKKIVEIINQLHQLFSDKETDNTAAINMILQELTEYANYHFKTEEKYFELFNYEKTASHTGMHNQYKGKIDGLVNKHLQREGESIFFELTNFLQEWWIWHINNTDRDYIPLFKEKGIK